MNWMNRMELISNYIEDHLADEIDLNEIAKLAYCSNYNFQRIFSFCMDISLAEYIRNRRLTLAAMELRTSNAGILDTAIKYGYNSQEAFTRAFIKFHGITPKQARTTYLKLNDCPKATFLYMEDRMPMKHQLSSYSLERKTSGELFKNKAPSPITLNFPVSLWSYMEYMGHNTNTMQTYTLLSTLCGDAYNAGLALTDNSGILTAMNTFGYPGTIYSTRPNDSNYLSEKDLRERIIHEIVTHQRPVIAINVVDCCFGGVIVGYQEDGTCLLNWGYHPFDFSDQPEPIITECNDWYHKTEKVIFIGDRSNAPIDLKQLYIHALKMAAKYLGNKDNLTIEDFFSEWKRKLFDDETFMHHDYSMIDPMWCDYAEKRFYAGQFMLQLKAFLPEHENELNELWTIFGRNINGLMYEYIAKVDLEAGADIETINIVKLQNKIILEEMCEIISKCEEEERKAAALITDLVNAVIPDKF